MLADENRSKGSHIRGSKDLADMHSPFIEMLNATLQRASRKAYSARTGRRERLHIHAGISYFFFSNNHTLSTIFGKPLGTKRAMRNDVST